MHINDKGMVEKIYSYRPTPNKGGALHKPSLIVVHDTAGAIDNDSSIDWLRNPQAKASAHFVIDRLGNITQLASCEIVTWHAGKSVWKGQQFCNNFSIGIEHVNPGKMLYGGRTSWGKVYDPGEYGIASVTTPYHGAGWWMPYTEAQLEASLNLILAIRDRYEIHELAAHYEISPGRKVDVNPFFPLQQFRGKLEGRQDQEMTIQAKPGAEFRAWPSFYKSNLLDAFKDDDGWFKPVKAGTYKVEGDAVPAALRGMDAFAPQLWYQVVLEAAGQEDQLAWIWSGHTVETRP